jgi:hypothetical protein
MGNCISNHITKSNYILTPPIFQLVILPLNFKLNKQFTTDLCDVNGVKYDEKNRITFIILPLM